MKIIVSQQGKKINIKFYSDAPLSGGRSTDLCVGVDKADDFLAVFDKFVRKNKINIIVLKKASLEFTGSTPTPRKAEVGAPTYTSGLTERVIRATVLGFCFNTRIGA